MRLSIPAYRTGAYPASGKGSTPLVRSNLPIGFLATRLPSSGCRDTALSKVACDLPEERLARKARSCED